MADVTSEHPLLTIELGVMGIGYDEVLPVGDGGGGGDEQDDDDDDDEEDDDDKDDEDEMSVLSVSGAAAVAEAVADAEPVG